jgi:hypothetical protein
MIKSVKHFYSFVLVVFALSFTIEKTLALNLSPEEMTEVVKISKSIALAKPTLTDSKKLEYALGIFKASNQFGIPANLLIAIAAQETSFRENLPEGKAGEYGIVQIRKIWVKNPKLKDRFKAIKIKDLKNPERAFLYAAWILKDLKDNAPKSAIPYWSYYNARGFEPRFKYFLSVNQKLSYLNRGIPFSREIEQNIQINGSADEKSWRPDVRLIATTSKKISKTPEPNDTKKLKFKNSQLITTASLGSEIEIKPEGWVAQALQRLQHEPKRLTAATLTVPILHLKTGKKPKQVAYSKTAEKLLKSIQD